MAPFVRLARHCWIEFSFRNPLMASPDTGLISNAIVVCKDDFIQRGFHNLSSGGRKPVPVPLLHLGPVQAKVHWKSTC